MSKLVIFDLDDTLRHDGFDCRCTVGFGLHLCEETLDILEYLRKKKYMLAIASHNLDATNVAEKLNICHFFNIIIGECESPATKMPLVNKILSHTGKDKKDIIFFDDLREITDDLKQNGIKATQINWMYGVRMQDILQCGL